MAAIKVLIVEDSPLIADVLKEALESDKRIRVVGVANDGQQAVELVPKLAPDLITMDVWMPVMDGFDTVEWVMAHKPTPILVITSSKLKEDVQVSLRMLAAGALDVIEKPALNDETVWKKRQAELIAKVRLLSSVRVITHVRGKLSTMPAKPVQTTTAPVSPPKSSPPVPKPNVAEPPAKLVTPPQRVTPSTERPVERPIERQPAPPDSLGLTFPKTPYYRAVAIASSTGGPTALLRVLQKLPSNFPCPIFIVQHISEGFTQGLVDWLQREVRLKMKVAQDNDQPQAGQVFVAPDRRNLLILPSLKVLTAPDKANILCPNADSLMHSVAQVYGPRSIGVVLTGMGNDGASGLKSMYESGAYTIAQDEASSLIYGMPRAAFEMGATREVLPLESIASRLIELARQPAGSELAVPGKD